MKVLFLVLLVPIVYSLNRPNPVRWVRENAGLVNNKIIRPNLFKILNPPQITKPIAYQYYDESWRKAKHYDDEEDYDEAVVVDSRTDWDRRESPSQSYSPISEHYDAGYPENIWFVFPRGMASKIREFAWHFYNMATRERQKHSKKRQTKQKDDSHSKPIAYQYYDDSWLRKDELELKSNYDDFNDDEFDEFIRPINRFKRAISSPNNETHISSNRSDNIQSSVQVNEKHVDGEKKAIEKDDVAKKHEKNISSVVRRKTQGQGSVRMSVTDYLFDTFFGVADQILAVKHKEREIAKEYLYEDIDVLEVLISQDAQQLSKYLRSKDLLQKMDQIMAVQVGATLLLREFKEKIISKKQFYELIRLGFSNDEKDQLKFLNALVENKPRLAFSTRTALPSSTPISDNQRKIVNKRITQEVLKNISDSALKDIINDYITVHFEVSKNILLEMYYEGKITKEQLDKDIERLEWGNSPDKNRLIQNNIENYLNAEILASIEYGKELLMKKYSEGKISKENYDRGIKYPKTINKQELNMKILRGLIEDELDKIPQGSTPIHRLRKDTIKLSFTDSEEDEDPNQKNQDIKLLNRLIQNLKIKKPNFR